MADETELEGLLQRASTGDERAFEDLVDRTLVPLRLRLASRVSRLDLVEEALQEAYVSISQELDRYRPCGKPMAWMATIARNRLVDVLRRRDRLATPGQEQLEVLVDSTMARRCEDESPFGEDEHEAIGHCLERLGDRERDLLMLHHNDGVSLVDLARRFRRTANAIGQRLFRIRKALRECVRRRLAGAEDVP